ncbi:MAG TPA: hypothetical protein VE994_08535 [Terriglobales bacterium]|nr:hypothetical protein [Terriglobales bacterium]
MDIKKQSSSIWPARLLVDLKSTLASRAAGAVDEAVRSVVTPDVLESIDSAVGEVFFSTVYTGVFVPTLSAIQAIWRGRNYRDGTESPGRRRIQAIWRGRNYRDGAN